MLVDSKILNILNTYILQLNEKLKPSFWYPTEVLESAAARLT